MSIQECGNSLVFSFRFREKKSQETFTDFGGFNIQNVRVFIITDTINIIICSSWEKHGLNSLQAYAFKLLYCDKTNVVLVWLVRRSARCPITVSDTNSEHHKDWICFCFPQHLHLFWSNKLFSYVLYFVHVWVVRVFSVNDYSFSYNFWNFYITSPKWGLFILTLCKNIL